MGEFMSKLDFAAEEFADRRLRTREAIASAGLDWLIIFHPVSIHWLTGSDGKSYQEFQCLFLSATPGPVVVVTRDGERCEFQDDALVDQLWTFGGPEPEDPLSVFERVADSLRIRDGRVGIEVPAYYLHPYDYNRIREFLGTALIAEPTNLIPDLKLVKSPQEIAYIREASRIGDLAMQTFAAALRPGRTELQVAADVHQTLMASGSALAASPMNLVSGERSCFSHGPPTMRVLRTGDFGSIEYGSTWRRYTSTIGRNFCVGQPTSRMRELHDLVRTASDACIAEIRAGVPAEVPHLAAKRVIADAGLNEARVHTSGYGLAPGFPPSWAEPLHMIGGSAYVLQAGMVITVEPPVFIGQEHLGARLIDNVLVTETGAELLSRSSRDLICVSD